MVGDTVNIASRVEAYCRTLNATVLVTGVSFNRLLLKAASTSLRPSHVKEGICSEAAKSLFISTT